MLGMIWDRAQATQSEQDTVQIHIPRALGSLSIQLLAVVLILLVHYLEKI